MPRWRLWLSQLCHTARKMGATLNWHRDPGYEQRMLRLRQGTEQMRIETEQIKRETEQLKLENARLRQLNARGAGNCSPTHRSFALCSTPVKPTEID